MAASVGVGTLASPVLGAGGGIRRGGGGVERSGDLYGRPRLGVNMVWELSETQSSCCGDLYGRPRLGSHHNSSTNQCGRAGDHQAPATLIALPPKRTEEPHEQ